MDKRNEIMKQAVHLFSLKGFHQTSVQEVAQAVGISKGAFYKHFDSKENMFIEILKQYHEEITAEISNSQHAPDSDTKDVFKKKLAIEIERTLSNQEFFMMVFKDFTLSESEKLKFLFTDLRQSTITLHKTILLDTYGTAIEPFLPDLVTVLEGLMQQYIITLVIEKKTVQISRLVNFITATIDAVVENLNTMEPVLAEARTKAATMEDSFQQIAEKINASESKPEKLLASLELLKEEVSKKEKKDFLIEALLLYLKQHSSIKNEVAYLENFI
ncbi:TetR/AcrR family transcriptional regulator [Planococcus sp. CPCC 101016]|uniref:TetR/AcrR family transcriptional regulator n=1 Tax=Planococcus sp. CPCC 101016 TaxID=2599617 RepID=UPI0011B47D4E|nr:TetR/AcrR family transcriptional regulator [Planococcus sp. CPCC 101016]TWT07175.1 TetR/AcrR family transcriptional regulator [Planococcus sp. CPCC 101016]